MWRINADGSGLHHVTDAPVDVFNPVMSPDGSRVAFHAHDPDRAPAWLLDPSKAWQEQKPEALPGLPGTQVEPHAWSPDAKWIACDDFRNDATRGIYLYSVDARRYEKLTDFGGSPRWLADSRRLVFQDENRVLYLLDRVTRERRQILDVAPDVLNDFAISPDGKYLYLTRGPREADIWLATFK